ncbi:MAG: hypothetical protein OQK04_08530 [Kangiellaceae bacterium]|nr:hypothetical protein [Kangiellaceae bacterium]MCW8998745.1 hypothetical protein [Kangiellaceae bacterium]
MQILKNTTQEHAAKAIKRIRSSICGIGIVIALGLISIQSIGLMLVQNQVAQSSPSSPAQQFVTHMADAGKIVLTSVFSLSN